MPPEYVCAYEFDEANSLLYLNTSYISIYGKKIAENAEEYVSYLKNLYGSNWTEDTNSGYLQHYKNWFARKQIFKYEYDSSADRYTFQRYFDGTLPSAVSFDSFLYGNGSYISIRSTSGNDIYRGYISFSSNGTFSGTVYKTSAGTGNNGSYFTALTSEGAISGAYSTSGTGTSNCSVTLNFTTDTTGLFSSTTTKQQTEQTFTLLPSY